MSERPRSEKEEKDEKGDGGGWDEKWRRDPVEAGIWALVLIWAGLVWLFSNFGMFDNILGEDVEIWSIIFLGGGVIVLGGVVLRLLVPAYRRPIAGGLILGLILLGIGLGGLTNAWLVIGPLILIGIGVGGIAAYLMRRQQ